MTGKSPDRDSTQQEVTKRIAASLCFLFLLALGLRLIRLFDLDLEFDEVSLLFRSQDSWVDIWNNCKSDNYAPLYPWLIKFWMLLGSGDNWYRLFGALAGSLTPPAAYLLGWETSGRKLAWLLALAAVLSPSLVFYSQFVRMLNVQTAIICLSLYVFFRALKTDSPRYWLALMILNLIGFYVYFFMLLVVLAEGLILVYERRAHLKAYARPLAAQLPFVIGVSLWLIPVYQRSSQVTGAGFWTLPFGLKEIVKVWLFLGTGSDFRDHYTLAALMNLPFLLGALGVTAIRPREKNTVYVAFVLLFVLSVMAAEASLGPSFFQNRYVLFVLPLYLLLALSGWLLLKKAYWRRLGIFLSFLFLGSSLAYYYIDYYKVHDYFAFARPRPLAGPQEGHSLSISAKYIENHIQEDEVIIHFSDGTIRIRSYFASLHYHQRRLPEYLYAKEGVPQYNGLQYLRPGEWIASLQDLPHLPGGIWLVSLSFSEVMLGNYPPRWVRDGNLPQEMRMAGFRRTETFRRGNVTVNHFRRTQNEQTR